MSITERLVHASPEAVWGVLADPDAYAHWVVGSKDIRDADPSWPADGTRFHHTLAFGPIDLKDSSEVMESEEPRRLVLHVMARPFGRGKVEMDLAPEQGGTRVTMKEGPASPIARITYNPLTDLLLHGRNVEALRRLAALAEGDKAQPTTSRNAGANAGGGEDGPAVGPQS